MKADCEVEGCGERAGYQYDAPLCPYHRELYDSRLEWVSETAITPYPVRLWLAEGMPQ